MDQTARRPIASAVLREYRRTGRVISNGPRRTVIAIPSKQRNEEWEAYDDSMAVFSFSQGIAFDIPQWLNPRGFFLYIVWDSVDDDAVLYVGQSSRLLLRLGEHSLSASWWTQAGHIDIFEYPTLEAVKEAEIAAIQSHEPYYNVHYSGVPLKPKRSA